MDNFSFMFDRPLGRHHRLLPPIMAIRERLSLGQPANKADNKLIRAHTCERSFINRPRDVIISSCKCQ